MWLLAGSLLFSMITSFSHTTISVTSCADAKTAQIVSFEILVLFRLSSIVKLPKSPINKA